MTYPLVMSLSQPSRTIVVEPVRAVAAAPEDEERRREEAPPPPRETTAAKA